ncbi:MAG TPA: DUF433 domain-containing protein [Hyphomicrobiaceae bacterium]|nr:DUF433 domain-containing protein [Hyphomicrobiaceae bacterium]
MTNSQIVLVPKIKFGKPVNRGTPIPVELLLKLLSKGHTSEQLLESYPRLTRDDILAAQAFAAEHLPRADSTAAE